MTCRAGLFHKQCFSCKLCNRPMDYSNFVDYKVIIIYYITQPISSLTGLTLKFEYFQEEEGQKRPAMPFRACRLLKLAFRQF
jgi:hypothetical protein